MSSYKNAPLTPKGRGRRCLSTAAAVRQFNVTPMTVAIMGRTVPRARCRWFARKLLQASFVAEPNGACHMRGPATAVQDAVSEIGGTNQLRKPVVRYSRTGTGPGGHGRYVTRRDLLVMHSHNPRPAITWCRL